MSTENSPDESESAWAWSVCATKMKEQETARVELETLREQNKQLEARMAVVLGAGPSTALAVHAFDRAQKLEARNAVLERLAKAVLAWDDHYSHKGLDHTSKEAVALRLEMHNAAVELRALSPKVGT